MTATWGELHCIRKCTLQRKKAKLTEIIVFTACGDRGGVSRRWGRRRDSDVGGYLGGGEIGGGELGGGELGAALRA